MVTHSTTEPRLNREAWLERALEVLRDEGIQGVRVERLARDLKVTKGSFYWHFVDRDDLFTSILQYWRKQYTDAIIEDREFLEAGDPSESLLTAITRVREKGLEKFELAIRGWAVVDPRAAKAVREVYKKRLEFIRAFYTRLGFDGEDADIRARITLSYLSWEPSMFLGDSKSDRLKLLKLQHELMTKT